MKLSATFVAMALFAALVPAQSIGPPINVLFPLNNNLLPADQEIVIAEDGSFVAVFGSLPVLGDVIIIDIDSTGTPVFGTNVVFPGANDVSVSNEFLVASRRSHFLVCYGLNGNVGDLVFIAKNSSGTWTATNVLFPAGNQVPNVGTRPVISDDEDFILCRGTSSVAEFVIIPVLQAAGVFSPGTPFNEVAPGGNTIPLSAVNPVIAPNSASFAVTTTNPTLGDLMIGTVLKPITAANTTVTNVVFPTSNNLLSTAVPPVASPMSNYWTVFGQPVIGDLVFVAMGPTGTVGTITNLPFPALNNVGYVTYPPPPPVVSGDGRLVAVNGSDANIGDVVLVPVTTAGIPGTPANVAFPLLNNVANLQLPPVVSVDGSLVVHRGSPTIGDLAAVQVTFTSPTTITHTQQNILYPLTNNVPAGNASVALAPDKSFAVTLGSATIGDIVITPFDIGGVVTQPPINVLYPLQNNVANLGTTPRISREGNLIITSGSSTIGDAVVTGVAIDYSTGQITDTFTTNVIYPLLNHNTPTTREPIFSPTTQFAISSGSPNIGDLVFIPLLDPFPRYLRRADVGTTVPIRIFSPTDAGKFVFVAAAAGRQIGQTLPDMRIVPLNDDFVFQLSLIHPNPNFMNFGAIVGPLDANGVLDTPSITIPPSVAYEGFYLYTAFVVLDAAAPLGIGTISLPSVLVVE